MTKKTEIAAPVRYDVSLFSPDDLYLFNEGRNYRAYNQLGSHVATFNGDVGTVFSVWAPNARKVSVTGSFNDWNHDSHQLESKGSSGIWEGFIPGVEKGALYKFHIVSHHQGYVGEKADPFGVYHEQPPRTASVVWDLDYKWSDGEWMKSRGGRQSLHSPISIYELHLGSWMRVPEEEKCEGTQSRMTPMPRWCR